MADIVKLNPYRARRLRDLAASLKEAGRIEQAIERYRESLRIEPDDVSFYNLALIHKYRNEWEEARALNRRAYELRPDHEATRWNLAIAATALRDWETAREMWAQCGVKLQGEGPINDNFGQTPVRINPDDNAEVVWARRIDPVRARLTSIPLAESGYRFGDIVLHDGAAVGYRMLGDVEKPVFNVLELFEKSGYGTWRLDVLADSEEALAELGPLCTELGIEVEDWTAMRILCKQCSEGHPHEQHDHEGDGEWQDERLVGAAALTYEAIERLAGSALPPGVEIVSIECLVAADADQASQQAH